MKLANKLLPVLLLAAQAGTASAGEWDFTGFVGADIRAFWEDARFPGQHDDPNGSLRIQPEAYWRSDDGDQRISFVGFGRIDSADAERTHADIREAHWSLEGDRWDINIGVNKHFWGVAESRHLVDVINQTDLVEDVDQEEKLGQPLLNANLQRDFGRFELFILPYFRERTFPGVDGRLRPPLPVDTDDVLYESADKERHVDYALRYSHFFGDLDVAAYVFDGTSREPILLPTDDGLRLRPYYEQMTQFGIETQYTNEAWLLKFEGISRSAGSGDFLAAVGGFEYSFYGIGESSADVGILLEYLYDGRGTGAPPTAFNNDVFLGTRLALNDAQDTSVLAGFVVDLDSQETFFNVEAERRFGDSLVAELRLRSFFNADIQNALYTIEKDDYVQISLSWFY